MQNFYEYFINDQEDLNNDVYSEILNDMHGHLDLDQLSKYHDLKSYKDLCSECTNHLKIIHINARDLPSKIDQLTALLSSLHRPPDVLCISETWLEISETEFCNIPGFYAYHVVRKQRSHGGVSIFVANHLNSNQLSESSYIHDDIEVNTIDVNVSNKTFTISAVYRPHSKHIRVDCFSEKLSQFLVSNDLRGKQIILVGDFNINLLEIDQHPPTHNFLTNLQSQNFVIHISRPTRFPEGQQTGNPSLLDHIYSNFFLNFKAGILLYDISDHLPVFINIPLPSVNKSSCASKSLTFTKKFRIFNQRNKEEFAERLSSFNWIELLADDNVNVITETFIDTVGHVFEASFPLKTKEISAKRLDSPWITSGVLNSIKTKNKLFKDFKLGLIENSIYTRYRNHLNSIIKKAKKDYYINYFDKHKDNVRKIWRKVNELNKVKSCNKTQKNEYRLLSFNKQR